MKTIPLQSAAELEKNSIQLNGEEKTVHFSKLIDLLKELKLPLATLLVEQNGLVLHRHELETATLSSGDVIEILQIAAGG